VFDVHSFTEVDASNIVEELVFVPVCIRLRFYKPLSCVSSDEFLDTNHLLCRTFLLGKL
jgi:hypothetical protein